MNFEMNSSLLTPSALTASIALHGIAIAFLADVLLSDQNYKIRSVQPDLPKIKIIEVSLKSVHSDSTAESQGDLANTSKLVVSVPPHSKQAISAKPTEFKQSQKQSSLQKNLFQEKNNKVAKGKNANQIKPNPIKKPDVLLSKNSLQDNVLDKKTIVSEVSSPVITKNSLTAKDWQQPNSISENQVAANSNAGFSKPQYIPANLTNHSRGISSSLPPLIKSRQPDYPEEARWEERTGKTILKFKISDQGNVLEPSVTTSSGHRDLDLAAIKAIQFWRFKAAENQAANQWYQYSFRFELN